MPIKLYSYICLSYDDDLCLGVSSYLSEPTNDDRHMMQLKPRGNNEKKKLDFFKMRWDINHVNQTIQLSAVNELCITKKKTPHAKTRRDMILVNCEFTEGVDLWSMENDLQNGLIRLVGTDLCATVMQCQRKNRGQCDPLGTKLIKLDRGDDGDIFVKGTYVKAYPCWDSDNELANPDIKESQTFRATLDCFPGCSPLFAFNGECDEVCRVEECDFDGRDCDTPSPTLPTLFPTTSPSRSPTPLPSTSPSFRPTGHPTKSPIPKPTVTPTHSPSGNPTSSPTSNPSVTPTQSPSTSPTQSPTNTSSPVPAEEVVVQTPTPTFGPTDPTCEEWLGLCWWVWILIAIAILVLVSFIVVGERYRRRRYTKQDDEEYPTSDEEDENDKTTGAPMHVFITDKSSSPPGAPKHTPIPISRISELNLNYVPPPVPVVVEDDEEESDESDYSGDWKLHDAPRQSDPRYELQQDLQHMAFNRRLSSRVMKQDDINFVQMAANDVNETRKGIQKHHSENPTVKRRVYKSEEEREAGKQKMVRKRKREENRNVKSEESKRKTSPMGKAHNEAVLEFDGDSDSGLNSDADIL
ncbi:MAG: hypothetical protein ACTSUE_15205 [Promethearchaeota archaeon]